MIEAKLLLLTGSLHLRLLQVHLVRCASSTSCRSSSAAHRTARRRRPCSDAHALRFGTVNTLAGDEFNRGIRAYYFGFAALGWFVHPALFAALTTLILLILWRRDFRSRTLRALGT